MNHSNAIDPAQSIVKRKRQVIHIFGASGSGTSTLARKICDELGYAMMDTDDYFWMPTDPPFTTKRSVEERIQLIHRDIEASENVVISGSLVGWGDVLIPTFTLAIRIVTDTDIRIMRIKEREFSRFGERICVGGDMYEAHQAFLQWASSYDTGDVHMRSKAEHDEWQKLLECKLLVIDGAKDLEVNFQYVKNEIL